MKKDMYVVLFRYPNRPGTRRNCEPGQHVLFFILLIVLLLLLPGIARADNFVGGIPLTTVQTGTVTGDLYIDATPPTWAGQGTSNIVKTFTLPENAVGNITWARLYVSAYNGHMQNDYAFYVLNRWDGNGDGVYSTTSPDFISNETGHAAFVYTGNSYCNDNSAFSAIGGTSCDPYKIINDHENRVTSDYFMWYDVTDKIRNRTVSVNVKTAGSFDGRTKVATLVVAYNDPSSTTETTYWVNQGHDVCSYYTEEMLDYVAVGTTSFGTAGIGTVSSAVLTVDYMASHNGFYGFPRGNLYVSDTGVINTILPSISFDPYSLSTGYDVQGPYSGVMHWDVTSLVNAFQATSTVLGYSREVSQSGTSAFYKIPLAFLVVKKPLPPTANFSADVTSGTAPLTVTFTDTSARSPTSWVWDFGDGDSTNATVQDPVHTYTSAGTYTVKLIAANTGGSNTTTGTGYITVTNAAPVATFSASPVTGTAPLTVTFTDTSTGSPTSWTWVFGDGNSTNATVQNPVHTYTSAGTYTVNLTVETSAGLSNATSKSGYVTVSTVSGAPVAAFSATPLSGTAPLAVTFSDASTGNIAGWAWDFNNDGTVDSSLEDPTYTYTTAGTYSVNLTVTGTSGSGSLVKTGYITVTSGTSDVPTVSLSPQTQSFGVGESREYQIVMDSAPEGLAGYDLIVSLATPGIAEITGVSYPSWGQMTSAGLTPNQSIQLSATDTNKQIQSGATGIILANITVRGDADGMTALLLSSVNTDSDKEGDNTIIPFVNNGSAVIGDYAGPVAGFSANVTSGTAPLYVQFTDTSTGSPSLWHWVFSSDGLVNSTLENPLVTYTTAGTYPVSLTVTNNAGSDTLARSGYITVTKAGSNLVVPVAVFNTNVTSGNVPLLVKFTDSSTNSPTSWSWDFNSDGTADSTSQNPVYSYTSAGTYTVTLTATNAGGSNTSSKTITVLPVAAFSVNLTSGTVPLAVSFTDTSSAGTGTVLLWKWTFGDGGTSLVKNPTHMYSTAGVYTAKLMVSSDASLWSDTATQTISVNTASGIPGISFSATPTSGTIPLTVQFTDASSGTPTSWSWNFGDGSTSTVQNPSHTYTTAGTYDVTLTATNAQGSATSTRSSYISALSASAADCDLNIRGSITPVGGAVFAHEPNDVYIYNIKNSGSETCTATTVKLVASDGFSGTATIPSLTSGSETTVTVTDATVRSEGKTVTYTATIDPSNTLEETTESNNIKTSSGFTAVWNGYKGKRYMDGGTDVTTQHYYDLHGNIVYDRGNSVYISGAANGGTWSDLTWEWTASQPAIPDDATVTAAYLYVPYTWDNSNQADSATLTFNGATISRTASYTDWSNFGSYSDYKYGLIVYDVTTSYAKNSENTAVFHRSDEWAKISMYEFYLVVVYTDTDKSRKQIFLNENFDLLGASTAYYGTNETESTAYVPFTGQTVDTSGMQRATLVTFVPSGNANPGETGEGNLIFNGNTLGTKVWNYGGSGTGDNGIPEIAVDSRVVTSYVQSSSNIARVQSTLDSGTPCMAVSQAFLIVNMGPTADFTASPTSGEASLAVAFTDKSIDATAWSWDFGDGSTSTDENPSHSYTTAGTYDVSLTATSAKGSDTQVRHDYITVTKKGVPVVDFYATPTSGKVSLSVTFTDQSTNSPTSWSWNFGDGSTSTSQNPTHTYTSVGTYSVSLTATNSIGSASATKSSYIVVTSATTTTTTTASSSTHIENSEGGSGGSGSGSGSSGTGLSGGSGGTTSMQSSQVSSGSGRSQAGSFESSGSGDAAGTQGTDPLSGLPSWLLDLILGAFVVVGAGGAVAHVKGYSLGMIAGTIVTGASACHRELVPFFALPKSIFWDSPVHPLRTIDFKTGMVRNGELSGRVLPRRWLVIAISALFIVIAGAVVLSLFGGITLPGSNDAGSVSFDVIPTIESIQDRDMTNHAPDYPTGFSAHNGIIFVYNGADPIPLDEIELDLVKGTAKVHITSWSPAPSVNAVGDPDLSYFVEEGDGNGMLDSGEWLMVYADSCYDASNSDAEPKTQVIGWHPSGTGSSVEVPLHDTIDYVLKDTSTGTLLQEGTLDFVPS